MRAITRALAVIDPTSETQPGLERAAWFAEQGNAELKLLTCLYDEYLAGSRIADSPTLKGARDDLVQAHRDQLEEMAEPLRQRGITVETAAIWDHPLHEGIVRQAVDYAADVVFKDTHHHSALARALFTNTDWNLIRNCPAMLWLVKPRDFAPGPNIVASIDPMNEHDKPAALDDQIIYVAQQLSSTVGGKLMVFHSYDPRTAFATATANAYVPVSLPLDEVEEQMQEQHQTRVREITSYHDIADDDTFVVSGVTHEALPDFAREKEADLVVMGAVARSRLKRLFIGATAERTLEHLPSDLLIVKPDGFETPVET